MIIYREPALQDAEFLAKMDSYPIREQMCKVVVLTFDEQPLQEITGQIVSGNLTIDGSSACRRTVSLQMITGDVEVSNLDLEIASKYLLYIGLRNFVDPKYDDMIWFPQGLFVATSLSTTSNMSGITVSLTGKDKMCLLDGSVGGAVFADHDFGKIEITDTDGTIKYEDIPIWRIIREAIHTYAHEPYENIIVHDLEDISVELLDYKVKNQGAFIYDISDTNIFSVYDSDLAFDNDPIGQWFLETNHYEDSDNMTTVYYNADTQRYYRVQKHLEYGDTAGYRRTELIFPGEFKINAGGSITSMLDKITQLLGEFEYFYDIYGRFIFQRKKIYHNVVWNGVAQTSAGIFTAQDLTNETYDLANSQNVESYANKPNLLNIRNDWVIWGKISAGVESKETYACHLRYAIDDKPVIYHCLTDGIWYRTKDTVKIEDDTSNCAQSDYNALVEDFRLANYKDGANVDVNLTNYVIQPCINAKYKTVDWRELIYRMAIDYSQAQSRVEKLCLARDNTQLLQIVDINRLLSMYSGEALGRFLTGQLTSDRQTYYDNTNKPYYGFWIYDEDKKRFRHIVDSDLSKENLKRIENRQTELTWDDWVRQNNKNIFFSLNSTEDNFNLGSILRANAPRRVYENFPVRGLGYVDQSEGTSNNTIGFTQRATAFAREIQMWERRLKSRYQIYFADLLAFWPIMYRTKNNLSELDLDADRTKILTDQSSSNIALKSIDFSSACTNYVNTVNSLLNRTDLTEEVRLVQIRAAANTYWQTLVTHYTQVFGTNAATTLRLSNNHLVSGILLNNSEVAANIPEGHKGISAHGSSELASWITMIGNYLKAQMLNVEPNNQSGGSYPIPLTVQSTFNNYKINVKSVQIAFGTEQAIEKRDMIANVYAEWVANGYWDPDIISYDPNLAEPIKILSPESMLFWFDFLDANAELGKYKISVIGHRPKVVNDDKVKAIFFRDTPNVLFMDPSEEQPEEHNLSYVYMQLSSGLSNYFKISTQGKSAKDELDTLLYESTYYQESITISCLPVYYLEPNTLIRAVDNNTGIRGKYAIKSLSLSLSYDGMMSIQANRAADRIL